MNISGRSTDIFCTCRVFKEMGKLGEMSMYCRYILQTFKHIFFCQILCCLIFPYCPPPPCESFYCPQGGVLPILGTTNQEYTFFLFLLQITPVIGGLFIYLWSTSCLPNMISIMFSAIHASDTTEFNQHSWTLVLSYCASQYALLLSTIDFSSSLGLISILQLFFVTISTGEEDIT